MVMWYLRLCTRVLNWNLHLLQSSTTPESVTDGFSYHGTQAKTHCCWLSWLSKFHMWMANSTIFPRLTSRVSRVCWCLPAFGYQWTMWCVCRPCFQRFEKLLKLRRDIATLEQEIAKDIERVGASLGVKRPAPVSNELAATPRKRPHPLEEQMTTTPKRRRFTKTTPERRAIQQSVATGSPVVSVRNMTMPCSCYQYQCIVVLSDDSYIQDCYMILWKLSHFRSAWEGQLPHGFYHWQVPWNVLVGVLVEGTGDR